MGMGLGIVGGGGGGGTLRAQTVTAIVPLTTGLLSTVSTFGLLAPCTFAKTSGSSNLTANSSTGGISATAALTAGATQSLIGTITAADGVVLPFTVNLTGALALTITGSPAAVSVGDSTTFAPTIGGGSGSYVSLSVIAGALPAGRAISGLTVTGAYTAAGAFSYTLRVTDSFGTTADLPVSGSVAAVTGGSPVTTVTWTTPSSNISPVFSVDVVNWLSTDVLEFQLDTSTAFASSATANIGAVIGMPATITSDPLSAGTYYARARVVRDGTPYSYSSVITVAIVLSAATAIDDPTVLFNSATVRIDL